MADLEDPENLIAAAVESAARDYPNPGRDGCPSPDALDALILSGTLPSATLRTHLLSCSECFRAYRVAVDATRAPQRGGIPRRTTWIASALAAGLVLTTSALFWRSNKVSPTADAPAPPTVITGTVDPVPPAPQPSSRADGPRASGSGLSVQAVRLDFAHPPILREAADPALPLDQVVSIRQARAELTLGLSPESPRGLYAVALVDAFGRVLRTTRATSGAAPTLTAGMDFSTVEAGTYRLCVAHADDVPECQPVVVIRRERAEHGPGS